MMRLVLLSSTEFGRRCLIDAVLRLEGVETAGIVTTPAVIRYPRRKHPMQVCTWVDFTGLAREIDCPVVVIDGPGATAVLEKTLREWRPDVVLVAGWYHLIPEALLELPPKGTIALHASLLPRYRGMAPIPWAIINGESETGVTLFYLDGGVDTGDIIAQKSIPIMPEDTCATIYEKATAASLALLREYLPRIADGTAPRRPQEHEAATCFPRRRPEDGLIDWSLPAVRLHDFVRGQTRPYPGAFTHIDGRKLIVWRAEPVNTSAEGMVPGTLLRSSDGVEVVCGRGRLRLLEAQWEEDTAAGDPSVLLEPYVTRKETLIPDVY